MLQVLIQTFMQITHFVPANSPLSYQTPLKTAINALYSQNNLSYN
jgi:hypothetical protein